MNFCRKILIFTLVVIGLWATACGSAKTADQLAVEAADGQISQSAKLKGLDKICRNLPVFEDFEPARKTIGRKNDIIYNYYKLQLNDSEAFGQIIDRMQNDGWHTIKEERDASKTRVEFEKGDYWVQVSYNAFTVLNYSTNCKDLSVSDR